jgi:hypothetical protein
MLFKKMLVIAPVMAQPTDIKSIARSLSFLEEDYELSFVDPLTIMNNVTNDMYYQLWGEALEPCLPNYDAFMGFSFGGVILQQCFSLFSQINKPIILFSTPTFADMPLAEKLGAVVNLCKQNRLETALAKLYDDVYYPDRRPEQSFKIHDAVSAVNRLVFGLTRVLDTDSTRVVQKSTVRHLHLIGEQSNLVNRDNVIVAPNGRLVTVPGAGMRVLEANLPYCKQLVLEALSGETQ